MKEQTQDAPVLSGHDLLAGREQINVLKEEHRALNDKKIAAQVQLTKIKNLVRTSGRMTKEKYKQCCDAQTKYVAQIQTFEKKMGQLKLEIQKLADLEYHRTHVESQTSPKSTPESGPLPKECIEALVALREKYQAFSADHTRVSSMRTMAAEFAFQLNPIIKAALKG